MDTTTNGATPPHQAIYRARRDQGITQGELAERAGVSRKTVSNIETGRTTGNPRILAILAEVLDIDLGDAQIDHNQHVPNILLPIATLLEEIPKKDQAYAIADMFTAINRWVPKRERGTKVSDPTPNLPEGTTEKDFNTDNFDLAAYQYENGEEVDYDSY
ncbi:helix-turn-helix domain-containing protein [Kocuria massiliensis]|uniref:helix-turn-helix domain-containing protein n=1 Tax=Kocuria massiliensis TaxID=1926282 RepID=UPI0022B99E0A|nr:helix-turn-helix transcriptional regulator [Kocuria massiliensis]